MTSLSVCDVCARACKHGLPILTTPRLSLAPPFSLQHASEYTCTCISFACKRSPLPLYDRLCLFGSCSFRVSVRVHVAGIALLPFSRPCPFAVRPSSPPSFSFLLSCPRSLCICSLVLSLTLLRRLHINSTRPIHSLTPLSSSRCVTPSLSHSPTPLTRSLAHASRLSAPHGYVALCRPSARRASLISSHHHTRLSDSIESNK
jgi:hypothetical protein